MATTFKPLNQNDIISTKTLLHENIPLTGTIVSGTYANDANIKTYSHGMFQSVYDYPYLSSSANHIFDITFGYSAQSVLSSSTGTPSQRAKKINIYNQMAQLLVGYDATGSILQFDDDGNILAGGSKIKEACFISFSRLLTKDEIKKKSFSMTIGGNFDRAVSQVFTAADQCTISDVQGSDSFKINSPAGEYGILYATGNIDHATWNAQPGKLQLGTEEYTPVGLIYYQAGVVVLTSSVFGGASDSADGAKHQGFLSETDSGNANRVQWVDATHNVIEGLMSSSIDDNSAALRRRIKSISLNNTTELNSTIYFCRVNHNEYNYSANPTYLSGSSIRVKTNASDNPISYITTVGLYSPDNQLLAVGKLSEPLRKDPTIEYTLRARLDY